MLRLSKIFGVIYNLRWREYKQKCYISQIQKKVLDLNKVLVASKIQNFLRFFITSNLAAHVIKQGHRALNIDKK